MAVDCYSVPEPRSSDLEGPVTEFSLGAWSVNEFHCANGSLINTTLVDVSV